MKTVSLKAIVSFTAISLLTSSCTNRSTMNEAYVEPQVNIADSDLTNKLLKKASFSVQALKVNPSKISSETIGNWIPSYKYFYLSGFEDYKKYTLKMSVDPNANFWALVTKIKNGKFVEQKWIKYNKSFEFQYLSSSFNFDKLIIMFVSAKKTVFQAEFTESNNNISANDLKFPASGTDWTNTSGSSFHVVNGGINKADDTNALDLNLNTPKHDSDSGKDVNPVFEGVIVYTNKSYGYVLVKHTTPLKLDDGTILNEWYSGYMHMSNIIANGTKVDKNTIIGNISNSGATNNHLHFAIYSGTNTSGGLKSINVETKLSGFSSKITSWF